MTIVISDKKLKPADATKRRLTFIGTGRKDKDYYGKLKYVYRKSPR